MFLCCFPAELHACTQHTPLVFQCGGPVLCMLLSLYHHVARQHYGQIILISHPGLWVRSLNISQADKTADLPFSPCARAGSPPPATVMHCTVSPAILVPFSLSVPAAPANKKWIFIRVGMIKTIRRKWKTVQKITLMKQQEQSII